MKGHTNRAHAVLSASGSSRWMNCTPSALLEKNEPNQKSVYAAEGELAHEYSENEIRKIHSLISEKDYKAIFSRIEESEFYNDDFVESCQIYIDYVVDQFKKARNLYGEKATIKVEERVDYSMYVPGGFGTSDITIMTPETLEVIDLKFGKGVRVSPVENSQGLLYGLGSFENNKWLYDFQEIKITIVQPRLDHIETWGLSSEELFKWVDEDLIPKAKMASEGTGELNPGDWCKFCKVKHKCKSLQKLALKAAQTEFSEELIDDGLLTDEEILESYKVFPLIQDWISSVTDYIQSKALEGHKWPGLKLVESNTRRVISDPEELKKELIKFKIPKKDFLEEKMISMSKMEKLLKLKRPALIPKYIVKPKGSPVLVPESDKRIEWNDLSQAQNDFSEDL